MNVVMMSNETNPTDYTITQLKKFLQNRNLPTTDNKADLIARLQANNPDIWNELRQTISAEELQEPDNAARAAVQREMTSGEDLATSRELELVRRERDLLRRELELVRREAELRSTTSGSVRSLVVSEGGTFSVKGLKDLLNEFDGSSDTFRKWKQQIELLQNTYSLNDNAMRVLISSRLKGKAYSWFHSKPEHVSLSTTDLLEELRRMFDHRSSKLT